MITKLDSKKVATKFVRVAPVEAITKVTVPCFFIHCENDKKVPMSAVEEVYRNKPGFKRLWMTQGDGHFRSYIHNPELYWYKVNKFLTKLRELGTEDREQEKICDHRTKITVADNKITVTNHGLNNKKKGILHEDQNMLFTDNVAFAKLAS
jgi:poly(3-hydroxyalkanoate) synthetase